MPRVGNQSDCQKLQYPMVSINYRGYYTAAQENKIHIFKPPFLNNYKQPLHLESRNLSNCDLNRFHKHLSASDGPTIGFGTPCFQARNKLYFF